MHLRQPGKEAPVIVPVFVVEWLDAMDFRDVLDVCVAGLVFDAEKPP